MGRGNRMRKVRCKTNELALHYQQCRDSSAAFYLQFPEIDVFVNDKIVARTRGPYIAKLIRNLTDGEFIVRISKFAAYQSGLKRDDCGWTRPRIHLDVVKRLEGA